MIKAPLNLTPHDTALKMPSPLTHSAVWFSRHKKKMPIKSASTRRLRYHMQQLIYGGRYLGSFGSQGYLSLSTNPNNVRRQKFSRLKRWTLSLKKEIITMLQNQSVSNPQTKTVNCLFSVFHHRKLIAQNITGLLALRFKRRYPSIVVKFAQMEVSA